MGSTCEEESTFLGGILTKCDKLASLLAYYCAKF